VAGRRVLAAQEAGRRSGGRRKRSGGGRWWLCGHVRGRWMVGGVHRWLRL